MGDSLQKRIDTFVRQVFAAGPGAWLVWCDPRRDWLPLLERVAGDGRLGGFALLAIDETTAGTFGGPVARKQLQTQLATGESFVLHVPVAQDELGWLWAQALLAERILVVTDHGYIHWLAGEEKNTEPPVAWPGYASRRALAYLLSVTLPRAPGALAAASASTAAKLSSAESARPARAEGHGGSHPPAR